MILIYILHISKIHIYQISYIKHNYKNSSKKNKNGNLLTHGKETFSYSFVHTFVIILTQKNDEINVKTPFNLN